MKKNGFTLVEIIATISILLVISTIVLPSAISISNKNKEKNYQKIIKNIESSAENFVEQYRSDIPFNNENEYIFKINSLGYLGLLKLPITNPLDKNKPFDGEQCVKVTKENDKLNYEVLDSCTINSELSINPTQGDKVNISLNSTINLKDYVTYSSTTTQKQYLKLNISGSVDTSVVGEHTITYEVVDVLNGVKKTKQITLNVLSFNQDTSGANAPILAEGMIPVTYDFDNDVWVRADTSSEWYNYDEQWWANAVTTTSTNRQKYLSDEHIGKEIPMDEINSMWVWIPRFKYRIPQLGWVYGYNNSIITSTNIRVAFENGTNTTGVTEKEYRENIQYGYCGGPLSGITDCFHSTVYGYLNSNYYTHPAFRDINNIEYSDLTNNKGGWDEELTGFWVGKFATGTNNTTCNSSPSVDNCKDVDPIIKPDVKTLGSQNVSTQFKTSLKFSGGEIDESTGVVTFKGNDTYGLSSNVDTHMMKNTEWGAVTYLSQSLYGGGYEVYINNSHSYTGRSLGKVFDYWALFDSWDNGAYSYNDKSCTTVTNNDLGNICTGEKENKAGQNASTTGNIYGIYDMHNINYSATMSNIKNYSGASKDSNSGFSGKYKDHTKEYEISGTSFPENKYYDSYSNFSSLLGGSALSGNMIMGDATWETGKWYGAGIEYDYEKYIGYRYVLPWITRGGVYGNSETGKFSFALNNGGSKETIFHTVLIPPQPE